MAQDFTLNQLMDLLPEDLKSWLQNQPPEVQKKAIEKCQTKGLLNPGDAIPRDVSVSSATGSNFMNSVEKGVSKNVDAQKTATEVVRGMQSQTGS
ncbi:hypothetical protein AB0D45_10790 [Streptomyces sp. NPDC048352]|uniref:hypothetical protein n=1 Tax=Streptomyces sp. NPDC048352 TaxID=3154718 RepID=UPI0034345408